MTTVVRPRAATRGRNDCDGKGALSRARVCFEFIATQAALIPVYIDKERLYCEYKKKKKPCENSAPQESTGTRKNTTVALIRFLLKGFSAITLPRRVNLTDSLRLFEILEDLRSRDGG
jgi:hypothetical protein